MVPKRPTLQQQSEVGLGSRMTKIAVVECIPEKNLDCSKEILKNFEKHNWVYLAPPKDQKKIPTSSTLP